MGRYIIKEMNDNMLPKLHELYEKVYPNNPDIVKKLTYKQDHPLHITTLVAIENDNIIGQANIFKKQVLGGIVNIGYHVDPNKQSKGVATKLVGKAIDKAITKGFNDFYIITEPENVAAQCVAKKHGFVSEKSKKIGNVLIYNKIFG